MKTEIIASGNRKFDISVEFQNLINRIRFYDLLAIRQEIKKTTFSFNEKKKVATFHVVMNEGYEDEKIISNIVQEIANNERLKIFETSYHGLFFALSEWTKKVGGKASLFLFPKDENSEDAILINSLDGENMIFYNEEKKGERTAIEYLLELLDFQRKEIEELKHQIAPTH